MRKAAGAMLLALGLAMLVFGWRVFSTNPQPKAASTSVEDGVADLSHDVVGSPATGEMMKGIVTGPVGHKIGALLVAFTGLTLASGAMLSLAPERTQA